MIWLFALLFLMDDQPLLAFACCAFALIAGA